jgi:hypothetical protein
MPITASTRRLALALTLALSLGIFVAALIGPSQTLAKAHSSTCSSAHHKTNCTTPACSHKSKAHHASKCPPKHAKKKAPALAGAVCEDGSAPARAKGGSFSCDDGSEPTCENGAIPTRSGNGKTLVCPIIFEEETSSGETECEEDTSGCSAGTVPGTPAGPAAGSRTCAGSTSEGAAVCEAES